MGPEVNESLGIAGSGTIACGLAVVASCHGDVVLWARSDGSASRALASISKISSKMADAGADPERVRIETELDALADATYMVEAVIEDHGSKTALLAELARHAGERTVIATTTSSLSIAELAAASGHPERFAGLHVFNPVPRMELVELVFPHDGQRGHP